MQYYRNAIGIIVALMLFASASEARAQSGACQMGARVKDRENRTGTVVEATGSDCRVKLEDGTTRYYLAWMLSAAGPAASADAKTAKPDKIAPGSYACVAAGGIAGTLRLVIQSPTEYADRNGKKGTYTFDAESGAIEFKTGAWEGFYGKLLGPRKIGISSRRGGSSNTICDLK